MSLASNLQTAFTRVATEFKAIRTLIGGTGVSDISGLATTDKTSLVGAINEVAARPAGGGSVDALSDVTITTVADDHILQYNSTTSQWENVLGSSVFDVAGAAAAAQSAAIAASQPKDDDLSAIAALTTTAYGRAFLSLADQAALMGLVPGASETVQGKIELATQTEVNTGTDTARAVTPATLQSRLTAYAQPKDADLDAIAALATTSYGRAFLTLADQAGLMGLVPAATETVQGKVELASGAETSTGTDNTRAVTPAGLKPLLDAKANTASLGYFATGTDAANLTGTLPTAVLPPLAVNEVFVVATEAAMLALTAQRGDVAIRTDNGNTYILAADAPATLANWKEITATGDVISVAGKTGTVTLVKGDVGLGNVDNTSDANKPVSTAQQTALNGKQNADATLTALAGLTTAANQMIYSTGADAFAMTALTAAARGLLDDATVADMRTTLEVYSKTEVGDPTTNFVTTFEAGLV